LKYPVHAWLKPAAWLAIVAIALVTVLPIELRPTTSLSPNRERFLVMAIVGALFILAYPKRIWIVVLALCGAAAVLEPLQFFALGRHPSAHDVFVKSAGATIGAVVGFISIHAAYILARRRDGLKEEAQLR
jgi:hypothetical protein